MMTFTINKENEIVAFATAEEAATQSPTPFDTFTSQQEFQQLASSWPMERLVAIWNSFSGVVPVKNFKSSKTAIRRIWERIQRQRDSLEPESAVADQPRRTAKRRAQGRSAASVVPKSGKRTNALQRAARRKRAKPAEPRIPAREGSKKAQVLTMLLRKGGATITEIAEKMGWQLHTVRGFMAGAMKKAGIVVESFKPKGGERTYRVNE